MQTYAHKKKHASNYIFAKLQTPNALQFPADEVKQPHLLFFSTQVAG